MHQVEAIVPQPSQNVAEDILSIDCITSRSRVLGSMTLLAYLVQIVGKQVKILVQKVEQRF